MISTIEQIIEKTVHDIDWFFKDVLAESYAKRRKALKETNEDLYLVIDHIIQYHVGHLDENGHQNLSSDNNEFTYPPNSSNDWLSLYSKTGKPTQSEFKHQLQQILLIYLKLDLQTHVNLKVKPATKSTRTRDKTKAPTLEETLKAIDCIIEAVDTPLRVTKFATGIWGVDNENNEAIFTCLTYPQLKLSDFVEPAQELVKTIVDLLTLSGNLKIASIIRKNNKSDELFKQYDDTYASLLIGTRQLVDALVYERSFQNNDDYKQILLSFFDLSTKWNVIESFNRMKLSQDEEDGLNQFMHIRSRPVTPSSQTSSKQQGRVKTPSKAKSIRTPPADPPARNTRSAIKKKVERISHVKKSNKH